MFHFVHFTLHPFYEIDESLAYYKDKAISSARFTITGNNTFKTGQIAEVHIVEWNYHSYMPDGLSLVLFLGLLTVIFFLMLGLVGKVGLNSFDNR